MQSYRNKVLEATTYLKNYLDELPQVGLLTGTGLGEATTRIETTYAAAYRDIPHFPVSTVESHSGNLVFGRLCSRRVVAMQGRFHLYEGYSPLDVTFPIRVMQALGVRCLIVSNAAGGLKAEFKAGDVMIIADHINLTGENPLVGLKDPAWGNRFPDMTSAYDRDLMERAEYVATDASIRVHRGVYAGLKGPSLETPAETRYLKIIGADAVGFSTVHEVVVAIQAGMQVLGLSIITNINDPDRPQPATAAEIIAVARQVAPRLETIVSRGHRKNRYLAVPPCLLKNLKLCKTVHHVKKAGLFKPAF